MPPDGRTDSLPARLKSGLLVNALVRRVNAAGGFATVLTKGDVDSGVILIICTEKGRNTGLFERSAQGGEGSAWVAIGPQDVENAEDVEQYLVRRRRFDPDLWLIELDIAEAQRFVAELE